MKQEKTAVTVLLLLMVNFISLPGSSQIKKNTFSIEGHVPADLNGLTVYLDSSVTYLNSHTSVNIDSAVIKDGYFNFYHSIAEPSEMTLSVKTKDKYSYLNFLPGVNEHLLFTLTTPGANFDKGSIKGSKLTVEYKEFQQYIRAKFSAEDSIALSQIKGTHDPAVIKKGLEVIENMRKRETALTTEFINKHPDYYYSLIKFREQMGRRVMDVPKATLRFNKLSLILQQSPLGKRTLAFIKDSSKLQIGEMAPDFTAATPEGKMITLSGLRGKYILVDFWASWCGPCRAENPNLVKAYERFKDKNFDVIGFSLDGGRNAWVTAIKDDHLPWLQVSELKGWESTLVKQFQISYVPQNYLLDPAGKIVALNLRGEELQKKLAELLNN